MSDELERLRADLEVLERYFCDGCARVVQDKIAEIEKAAADPWREAKNRVEIWRAHGNSSCVVSYVDHLTAKVEAQRKQIDWLHTEYNNRGLQISELTAENASLEKRVKELEAEISEWKKAASVWTVESEMIDTPERLSERICELCGVPHGADMQPQPERPSEADPWRNLREALSDWNGALDNGKVIGKKACDAASQLETLFETNDCLTAENARLAAMVAEMEAKSSPIDPDGYQLGDFRVMKTAQEIARYAMDRNMDQPVTVKTAENNDLKQKYDLANSTIKIATDRLNEVKAENARLEKRVAELDIAYCHVNSEADRLTKRVNDLEKASEIVRRLAEWAESDLIDDVVPITDEAKKIWAEMKGTGDEQA